MMNEAWIAGWNAAIESAAKVADPSDDHRKDASLEYLGGDEGVVLLDGIAEAIRELKK